MPIPTSPPAATLLGRTATSLTLSWQEVEGALSYTLTLQRAGDVPVERPARPGQTTEGLTPNAQYVVSVRAANEEGSSPRSNTVMCWTRPVQPNRAPETFSSPTTNAVTIAWDVTVEMGEELTAVVELAELPLAHRVPIPVATLPGAVGAYSAERITGGSSYWAIRIRIANPVLPDQVNDSDWSAAAYVYTSSVHLWPESAVRPRLARVGPQGARPGSTSALLEREPADRESREIGEHSGPEVEGESGDHNADHESEHDEDPDGDSDRDHHSGKSEGEQYGPFELAPDNPVGSNVVEGEIYQRSDGALVRYEIDRRYVERNVREVLLDPPRQREARAARAETPRSREKARDWGPSRSDLPSRTEPIQPEREDPDLLEQRTNGRQRESRMADQSFARRTAGALPVVLQVPLYPPGESVRKSLTEALEHRYDLIWFYAQVSNRGPKDYKQLGKWLPKQANKNVYEDAGNYNYGVMAYALGLSLGTALSFAGRAQIVSNQGLPLGLLINMWIRDARWADDPHDQEMIRRGYQSARELLRGS